ncbi:MAG: ABC transporter ATP-binding protein [Sphingobacteriales bacterium]|nr:MAG: ABC transporter ATP-binding protein [Sphingobacteriales bacterium]
MKTYLRILSYAAPYKGKIALYIISTLLAVIFAGLTFYMVQPMLELLFNPQQQLTAQNLPQFSWSLEYLRSWISYKASLINVQYGRSSGLLFVTLFVVSLNLLGNIFKFFSNVNLGTIRTKVVEDLRESVFAKLIGHQVSYVENERRGDLMSRVTSDVTEVEYSVVITFESIIRDPFNIIYLLALMVMESWQLTLFIFTVLPVSAFLISKITKSLKRDATSTQHTYGQIMSTVDETIGGVRVIKAFRAESYIKSIFDKFNIEYSQLTRAQWHKKALVPIFSESAMVAVVGMTMWYGGNLVYAGEMKASTFIAYIGLFFLLSRPAKGLSQAFSNIYKGIASGERLFQLMDAPVTIKDAPDAKPVKHFSAGIYMENVWFAYGKEPVLKNINIKIEKGKTYALVGPSGSGKSTLAELLLRFYDPTQGQILLDGNDLRSLKTNDLRNLMAVVTQEPILFNDSIYNNIAFGIDNINENDVIQAAKAANAHNFIMETENGYQTSVGDRGGLLSGGQRQRISIARALLKNPAILILDEATSALDTSSEKIVQEALYKLMENRTSVVIAHRLSTIQDADEIIVLDKGEVIEQGSHQQLIAKNGLYRSLYFSQQMEM